MGEKIPRPLDKAVEELNSKLTGKDITNTLTWSSSVTFPSLKSARYLGMGLIEISATITLSNYTNGTEIVTLPQNAEITTIALGAIDGGNGVPVLTNSGYVKIDMGSKDVKAYVNNQSGFMTFTIIVQTSYSG